MTDYVVGDIQGCYDSLIALLDKVSFSPDKDTLYCVGDLVNRGPKSLETLEFLYSLGSSVKVVLGNHDLHLISCHYGLKKLKPLDTAQPVLDCPKADFWIEWLKQQPLMIHNAEKDFIVCHAGLYPGWTIQQGLSLSNKFSKALKSDKYLNLLDKIYGNKPNYYDHSFPKLKKLRFTVNAFTRMRYCFDDKSLDFSVKHFPENDSLLVPWFTFEKKPSTTRIIFGHWSSLGLYHHNNNICIDTGCVWGNLLTLYNIDNDSFVHQDAID